MLGNYLQETTSADVIFSNAFFPGALRVSTFSPYPQIMFFPPQIYLKIKKREKQEYIEMTTSVTFPMFEIDA